MTTTSSCRLFTLIGPAGVGKSRLVADFLDGIGDVATVARGRALSYGEGITYWPLVEMLVQLGIEPGEVIRSSPADTQLATRALLERLAEERPLVLVLDDLHWAEPPLLDLVEHVCDWSRGRTDLPALHRASRAAGRPSRLGGRKAERDLDPAGASRARARRRAGRRAARRPRPRARDAGANARDSGGESAVPRGDGRARAGGARARSRSRRRSMRCSRHGSTRSAPRSGR